MIRTTSYLPPYRSDLDAALRRLDALRAHGTDCEACARRAERRLRRRASLAKLARSAGAMGVGVVLTVIGIVALLSAMLAVVFLLADAGGSVTAPCADFGCAFGARPENIPSEAAIAIAALMTVWASVWGVGRCFRWGLTKGGFYAHFDSKEDLARAVIDHATTTWMDKVASHVARFADPREQLRELLEAYRLYAVDRTFEGGCFFVNLSTEVDDQHEDLRKLVDDRFVQFRMMVMTIIEMGKAGGCFRLDAPSSGIATAVVGYLTGTMMQAKATQDFTLFDAGNQVMAAFLASFEITALPATEATS